MYVKYYKAGFIINTYLLFRLLMIKLERRASEGVWTNRVSDFILDGVFLDPRETIFKYKYSQLTTFFNFSRQGFPPS